MTPARQLRNLADTLEGGAPIARNEAAVLLRLAAAMLEANEDPLGAFPIFDVAEDELGVTYDGRPGFQGRVQVEAPHLLFGIAAGWTVSTMLDETRPGVFLKLAAGLHNRTEYHKLEAILDANVARELGVGLYGAAERAPLDQAASDLWDQI